MTVTLKASAGRRHWKWKLVWTRVWNFELTCYYKFAVFYTTSKVLLEIRGQFDKSLTFTMIFFLEKILFCRKCTTQSKSTHYDDENFVQISRLNRVQGLIDSEVEHKRPSTSIQLKITIGRTDTFLAKKKIFLFLTPYILN